jgi:hypothetical protein
MMKNVGNGGAFAPLFCVGKRTLNLYRFWKGTTEAVPFQSNSKSNENNNGNCNVPT